MQLRQAISRAWGNKASKYFQAAADFVSAGLFEANEPKKKNKKRRSESRLHTQSHKKDEGRCKAMQIDDPQAKLPGGSFEKNVSGHLQ